MSKASQDLSGQRFGRWTVLRRSGRKYYYVCRCDCGTEKEIYYTSLIGGKSRGCPRCASHSPRPESSRRYVEAAQDKVGQTINGWEVTDILPETRSGAILCRAVCPRCGRPADVKLSHLPSINQCAACARDIGKKSAAIHAITNVDGSSLTSVRSRTGGKINKNSDTKINGVSKTKLGRYRAYINFRRKQYHLGVYDTLEEAAAARKEAEALIYAPYLKDHDGWEEALAMKLAGLSADKK